MRNMYPGKCYVCSAFVAVGQGHFKRYYNSWRVQCARHPIEKDEQKQKERTEKIEKVQ